MSPSQSSTAVAIMAAFLVAAAGAVSASADTGRWRIDRRADGATASLSSMNTLSMGGNRAIEYHPSLVISCESGVKSSWAEAVRMRGSVSGRDTISISIQIDGEAIKENWRLEDRNSTLIFAGNSAVRRLAGSGRLKMGWRADYFADGEVVFNLAGIGAVVGELAALCGIDRP